MEQYLDNLESLADDLLDVLTKYNKVVPLAAAIGVLEIIKSEVINDHKE